MCSKMTSAQGTHQADEFGYDLALKTLWSQICVGTKELLNRLLLLDFDKIKRHFNCLS